MLETVASLLNEDLSAPCYVKTKCEKHEHPWNSLHTKRLYRKTPRHINIKNGIYEMKNEDFFPVSHLDAKNQVLTSLSQLQRKVFLR